jgi:hypothetical protein
MRNKLKSALIATSIVTFLVACGGGGGGGGTLAPVGPVTSNLTFPVSVGIRAILVNGLSKNFVITGTCTGAGTRTSSPANTVATFEGVSGFSSATTTTITVAGSCTSSAQTSTDYYDTNYVDLGFNSVGVNYGVYSVPPVYPSNVNVGSTGVIGAENLYTDSTKAIPNGASARSYVVTADTATTAIINLISKLYNASAVLTVTEQDYWRVDASGNLTPISVDIQYQNGNHLVLTYI